MVVTLVSVNRATDDTIRVFVRGRTEVNGMVNVEVSVKTTVGELMLVRT